MILEGKIVAMMMMVVKIIYFAVYFMMLSMSQVCSIDSGMRLVEDK